MRKHLLSTLLISVALPFSALAQTATPPAGNDATQTNQKNAQSGMSDAKPAGQGMASATETFVTVPETGAWRVSDLQGKSVYGSEGESIGEINDVLVSQNGSVNAVVIGVGGFLGIGEKDVAVNMSALQLGPGASQAEADAATAQTGTGGTAPPSATNGTTTPATPPASGEAPATGGTAMSPGGTTASGAEATQNQTAPGAANGVQIGDDGLPDRIILNATRQQLEDAPAFEGVKKQQ